MRFKKSTISAIVILVSLMTIIGLSGLNFIFRENPAGQIDKNANQNQQTVMEKIYLQAKDGSKIAANVFPVENPSGYIVFSHMMPVTKESWSDFAQALQAVGYESIAIDLRGHGESDGGPNGYLKFSDSEHQKSILDVEAVGDYLIQKGAAPDKIYFIGASIGANLSLEYIVKHPESKTAVLLSPGLNYRGLETLPLVKKLKASQRVFFVSAKDDNQTSGNNAEENQKLYDIVPAGVKKEIKIYDAAGHGTTMLQKEPELKQLIFNFISL